MANKLNLGIFVLIASVVAQATWVRAVDVVTLAPPEGKNVHEVTEHIVGGDRYWTTGVDYVSWAKEREFFVGDIIVFNYCPRIHNVVVVDEAGYNSCSAEKPLMELRQAVHNKLAIAAAGTFGFISSMEQDCQNGLKLLITVKERK